MAASVSCIAATYQRVNVGKRPEFAVGLIRPNVVFVDFAGAIRQSPSRSIRASRVKRLFPISPFP
jgi:hypothetical protein